MANREHIALFNQGVPHWNQWRRQHPEIQPDLRGASLKTDLDLSGVDLHNARLDNAYLRNAKLIDANLSDAYLNLANLYGANLRGANLSYAILSVSDLSYTNLQGADLHSARLYEANLNHADLSHASLRRVNLALANLSHANLRGAIVWETVFADIDLRQVKGLTELHHDGLSYISLHSVLLPQDGSALQFLRGAGIPEEWITFYQSTMMHLIHYHSCFISYTGHDETLARRLHADLQNHGVRCWFAPEDLKIGDKIRVRIDEAIHLHEKLLLLLSEHALASTWVEDEVEAALEKEQRQQREVLFPVRLDESVMQTRQAWAAKLRRTRYIGDFTHWTDPQEYQRAFERLLRDLKAETERERSNHQTQKDTDSGKKR